jgi:hypothetical protein
VLLNLDLSNSRSYRLRSALTAKKSKLSSLCNLLVQLLCRALIRLLLRLVTLSYALVEVVRLLIIRFNKFLIILIIKVIN